MKISCPATRRDLCAFVFAAGAFAALAGAPVRAADPPPAVPAPADAKTATTLTSPVKCASVVIRNCRPQRLQTTGSSASDKDPPARWEAVRVADQDAEEILVEEERLRDPLTHEVFERYLQTPPESMITRRVRGGARCTTITSTGATLCSRSGDEAPTLSVPHTDFSDSVF